MPDTLKEFLVSLGFKVDDASWKRFQGGVARATSDVTTLGAEAVATATAIGVMVEQVARRYEDLYYVGQRTSSLVSGLKEYRHGMEQIGVSAEAATGALESFSATARLNPALAALGGKNQQDMINFVARLKQSGTPYFVAAQFAALRGIDERTFFQMYNNIDKLRSKQGEYALMLKSAGFDADDASKKFLEYSNSVDTLQRRFTVLKDRVMFDFLPSAQGAVNWLDQMLKKFTEWNTKAGGAPAQAVTLGGTGLGVIAAKGLLGKIFPGLAGGGGMIAGTIGAAFSVAAFTLLGKAVDEMYGKEMNEQGVSGVGGEDVWADVSSSMKKLRPYLQKKLGYEQSSHEFWQPWAITSRDRPWHEMGTPQQTNTTTINIAAGPTAWDTAQSVAGELNRVFADYLRHYGLKVQ